MGRPWPVRAAALWTGLLAAGILCGISFRALAVETNLYHYNVTNILFEPTNLPAGTPVVSDILSEEESLERLVGPFNVRTNAFWANEYEMVAWGYPDAPVAWATVLGYYSPYNWAWWPFCMHTNHFFDNVGWVKGVRSVPGPGGSTYGASLWLLQNTLRFMSSTTDVYVSSAGVTSSVLRVQVGSLGDYNPSNSVTEIGPTLDTNYPGWNTFTTRICRADTRAFYKLPLKATIPCNDGDVDGDSIPDFADGFNWDGVAGDDDATANAFFQPWKLTLPAYVDVSNTLIKVEYSNSPPAGVIRTGSPGSYVYAPATGALRVWTRPARVPRNKLPVLQNGHFVAATGYKAADLGFTPDKKSINLYIEGVRPSTNQPSTNQSIRVTYSHKGAAWLTLDGVNSAVISVDVVPDWNHDREITSEDENQAATSNPFRFWKNDDDDFGDISEGDSDVPGQGGQFDNANCDDDEVNGRSDLLDFFPVWLDIHDTLNLVPSGTVQYKLKQADGAVRAIYTDLTKGTAGAFLTTEGNTYGPSFNQNSYEADTFEVTSFGVTLSADFLDKIKNDATKGILLIEGKSTSTAPLVLEVWKDGAKICEKEMPLRISGAEALYRWVNIRAAAGGDVSRATDTNEPANNPDARCNGKNFIFVHGYSVSETAAKGWNAEIFKRLYQSGSRAMFTAITWFGNEGQVLEWIPWLGGSTPDYYANVVNAFETSSNLAVAVTGLSGTKYIAGHSLGNMLVSSAIKDNGLSVNTYFLIDAATAREAYNPNALHIDDMRNPDWQNYSNRLWASEWHQLFGSGDGRNALTWRNRFQGLSIGLNYYSSTEDVLDNGDGDLHNPLVSHWAWYNQEVRKGTTLMWLAPGNCEGGWGFNAACTNEEGFILSPTEANSLTDDNVRTNSFFAWFDEDSLYGIYGSAVAQQPAIYRRLLADGVPALSFAMGRNSLSGFGSGNKDLSGMRRGDNADGDWPRPADDWQHSDIKNIAYPFNYRAFDELVFDGVLK